MKARLIDLYHLTGHQYAAAFRAYNNQIEDLGCVNQTDLAANEIYKHVGKLTAADFLENYSEEYYISGCEGKIIQYAGKQYVLSSEMRYTISDTDWPFIEPNADAREIGTDAYVTIYWIIKRDELDKWVQAEEWDNNIQGILSIDPDEV